LLATINFTLQEHGQALAVLLGRNNVHPALSQEIHGKLESFKFKLSDLETLTSLNALLEESVEGKSDLVRNTLRSFLFLISFLIHKNI